MDRGARGGPATVLQRWRTAYRLLLRAPAHIEGTQTLLHTSGSYVCFWLSVVSLEERDLARFAPAGGKRFLSPAPAVVGRAEQSRLACLPPYMRVSIQAILPTLESIARHALFTRPPTDRRAFLADGVLCTACCAWRHGPSAHTGLSPTDRIRTCRSHRALHTSLHAGSRGSRGPQPIRALYTGGGVGPR